MSRCVQPAMDSRFTQVTIACWIDFVSDSRRAQTIWQINCSSFKPCTSCVCVEAHRRSKDCFTAFCGEGCDCASSHSSYIRPLASSCLPAGEGAVRAFGWHRGLIDLLVSATSVFMSRRAPYPALFHRKQMSHSRGTLLYTDTTCALLAAASA